MAFPSPIVNARMPKVMEMEIIDPRILASRLVRPTDMFGVNGLSIPMEETITIQGPHLQGLS